MLCLVDIVVGRVKCMQDFCVATLSDIALTGSAVKNRCFSLSQRSSEQTQVGCDRLLTSICGLCIYSRYNPHKNTLTLKLPVMRN